MVRTGALGQEVEVEDGRHGRLCKEVAAVETQENQSGPSTLALAKPTKQHQGKTERLQQKDPCVLTDLLEGCLGAGALKEEGWAMGVKDSGRPATQRLV